MKRTVVYECFPFTTCRRMIITPAQAKAWIEATGGQNYRPQTKGKIKQLAEDLAAGKWQFNGSPIVVDRDPVTANAYPFVRDGLHRLYACLLSRVNLDVLVIWDIDEAAEITRDRGKPRTLTSELAYLGEKNASAASAVTRAWYQLEVTHDWVRTGTAKPSDSILIDFWKDRKNAIEPLITAYRSRESGQCAQNWIPIGIGGVVLLEGTKLNFANPTQSGLAMEFLRVLTTGDSPGGLGSPVLALRNRLFRDSKSNKTSRMTPAMKKALTITAWNLHLAGEAVQKLHVRLAGDGSGQVFRIDQAQREANDDV